MKYSDIQLTDKSTWQQYQKAWKGGDFSATLSTSLDKKKLTAELLNELTSHIHNLQGDIISEASQLKADKIQVLTSQNPILSTNEIYFQRTKPYKFNEIDDFDYTFTDIDNLNITWEEVDEGGW